MTAKKTSLLPLTAMALLLAGCGDDLDSRQAAAESQLGEREVTVRQQDDRADSSAAQIPVTADFEDAEDLPAGAGDSEDNEELVVDAAPDDLLDSAQGFSADPMDDASGIDPSPMAPESFDD